MPGTPVQLGPFTDGLHNSAGTGEYIKDKELFELVNLEVDTDGSLANRPAIYEFEIDEEVLEYRVIGTYYLEDSTPYLVVSYEKTGDIFGVALVDLDTGTFVVSDENFTDFLSCGVQYVKKFYVYPSPGTSDQGGFFDDALTWTADDLPGGQADACVIYNERLFATSGANATADKSRLYFSDIADPIFSISDNTSRVCVTHTELLLDSSRARKPIIIREARILRATMVPVRTRFC